MTPRIDNCRMLEFPTIWDPSGGLTFLEGGRHIPFDIRRVFFIYDVPTGESRGTHAHIELHQVVIALSGSIEMILDDGTSRRSFELSHPHQGLYICPMVWTELVRFSEGAVCLAIASELFDEQDYIRDYSAYIARLALERR